MELLFNGLTYYTTSVWSWDYAGAKVLPHDRPVDFYLSWDVPGEYVMSLSINYGVVYQTLYISCLIVDHQRFFSLGGCKIIRCVVSWDPVDGASSYVGSTSDGVGILTGTTFMVTELEDNTSVDIIIEALGSGECGPTLASVQCKTPLFIEPAEYMPTIFSPNGDGINDFVFVQTNSRITEVTSFRIFDRWGNMVFEDHLFTPNDSSHGWDGVFKGKTVKPRVFCIGWK